MTQPPEHSPGQPHYDSLRDFLLHLMCREAWGNESGGDVTASTGWFARISNSDAELPDLEDAFGDEMTVAGFTDRAQLIGHFLVVETVESVEVTEYADEDELTRHYKLLERLYEAEQP